MPWFERELDGDVLHVDYPIGWHLCEEPVVGLAIPQQMFGVCNRLIPVVGSGEDHPGIALLDAGAIFIWACLLRSHAPDGTRLGSVPRLGTRLPIAYRQAAVSPACDRRNWPAGRFLWRRMGADIGENALSIMVWEGLEATRQHVSLAADVVSSITVGAPAANEGQPGPGGFVGMNPGRKDGLG